MTSSTKIRYTYKTAYTLSPKPTPIEKYHKLRKKLITKQSKALLDDLFSELADLRKDANVQ